MLEDELHIRKNFGAYVKKLREERGWSQADLSHAGDFDPGYVGKIERGIVNPGLTYIVALARAFKISPSKLLEHIK